MAIIFKILGVLGLVLISIGILIRKRKNEDIFYILGGLCLQTYSIYIGDVIFIVLQLIFVLVALYDFFKRQLKKR